MYGGVITDSLAVAFTPVGRTTLIVKQSSDIESSVGFTVYVVDEQGLSEYQHLKMVEPKSCGADSRLGGVYILYHTPELERPSTSSEGEVVELRTSRFQEAAGRTEYLEIGPG
jgi:hypothetical protein